MAKVTQHLFIQHELYLILIGGLQTGVYILLAMMRSMTILKRPKHLMARVLKWLGHFKTILLPLTSQCNQY